MTRRCALCDAPSVLTVNGVDTCVDHAFSTVDLIVDAMAVERGIPIGDARHAVAKLLREALGQ